MPLISVIIPIYQAERFLRSAVDSVLGQTYGHIELILVDDGSTDGSGSICDEYAAADPRVKVIHQKNQGVCAARNAGLDAAQGEYVAFLDADDQLVPDALSFLLEQMTLHGADISVGSKINCFSDGREDVLRYGEPVSVWKGTEALARSLEDHHATHSVWGKLYTKEWLEDVRFVVGKRIHEDSFFVFQCLLKQPTVVVNDRVVLRYNMTDGSASRGSFSEKYFDILYFAEQKKKALETLYPEMADRIPNLTVKANMALLYMLCNHGGKEYRKEERACIRAVCVNKKGFVPANQNNKKWFWIITHHLYGVYKAVRLMKKRSLK